MLKTALLLLVLGVAIAGAVAIDSSNECSLVENQSLFVMLPDPGNCRRFFVCAHGKPISLTCAKGLRYNPAHKRCDWAQYVECAARPEPTTDDPPEKWHRDVTVTTAQARAVHEPEQVEEKMIPNRSRLINSVDKMENLDLLLAPEVMENSEKKHANIQDDEEQINSLPQRRINWDDSKLGNNPESELIEGTSKLEADPTNSDEYERDVAESMPVEPVTSDTQEQNVAEIIEEDFDQQIHQLNLDDSEENGGHDDAQTDSLQEQS